ncbi:LysR family transcriptional regulator [Arthrobacter sp. HS15c]|uniref:LysR family transcriptional regulator n=1 Tax=Arthrobacter sp. HS15c TaxID=3230279 RepID=UPI0034656D7D
MSTFTLRHLEYFVAVAEEGSVTAAARKLNVSPGGVSVAISELETSLATQLTLRRRAKGVTLTPAGRHALSHARAVLRESGELQNIARVIEGELVGTIRIGCFNTLSPWLMPRIVEYFMTEHPGVSVEMVEDSSNALQQRLLEGDLDACLIYRIHARPGVDWEDIVPVRLQILLPPTHKLADRSEISLGELSGDRAILLSLQPASDIANEMLSATGFTASTRMFSNNVETIRSMVARGIGYSVLMGRPAGDTTYDGLPVLYKRIADDMPANSVVLARPGGSVPNAKVQALSTFCRIKFGSERHPVQ